MIEGLLIITSWNEQDWNKIHEILQKTEPGHVHREGISQEFKEIPKTREELIRDYREGLIGKARKIGEEKGANICTLGFIDNPDKVFAHANYYSFEKQY